MSSYQQPSLATPSQGRALRAWLEFPHKAAINKVQLRAKSSCSSHWLKKCRQKGFAECAPLKTSWNRGLLTWGSQDLRRLSPAFPSPDAFCSSLSPAAPQESPRSPCLLQILLHLGQSESSVASDKRAE